MIAVASGRIIHVIPLTVVTQSLLRLWYCIKSHAEPLPITGTLAMLAIVLFALYVITFMLVFLSKLGFAVYGGIGYRFTVTNFGVPSFSKPIKTLEFQSICSV